MKCSKCPGDQCSGLCSLFEEFDDDAFYGVPFDPSSFEIDNALCRIFESNGVNQDDVLKIDEYYDPKEKRKASKVEDSPEDGEPRSERKRKNEKNRRNQVNEGFDALAKLIFHIDPQLKAAAQAQTIGIKNKKSSKVDDTKLLGRVELVNAAVATLSRIHQENEFHKNAISQYATGQTPSVLPDFPYPSLLDLSSTDHDDDSEAGETQESRAARKKHREKKRRDAVNKGLDQLMDLIFIIDPQIKVAAEEKARLERAVGRRNSNNYLLSRVELMKIAVATMARSHQDNEVHRRILAHLSSTHDQDPSVTPPISQSSSEISPFDLPPSEVLELTTSWTIGSTHQPPLPLIGEEQVNEKALVSFSFLEAEFADFEAKGVEPVAKRLKQQCV